MRLDHDDTPRGAHSKPRVRIYETPVASTRTTQTPPTVRMRADVPLTPTTRTRRGRTAGLFVLALLTGAVGGGAAGTFAATRSLPVVSGGTSVVAAEPVSRQEAPATNVAGAVFAAVSPSVVELSVAGATPMGTTYGGGSGFVVDARGLILTNNHVVEGAEEVDVEFSDGTTRTATVLGTDRGNDLALLKVDLPPNVPVARLADSDAVTVGETAVAIGSPFGLEQTVTQGIVSAIHRTWSPAMGRTQRDLLQTDAPINPGNSGGPLLNAQGEVIGVNSMIESPVRGSVGVGFAIPINTAKQLIPQLESGARLEPVWLGIRGGDLTAALAEELSLPVTEGVSVADAVAGGPAARAGLQAQDIITGVDGKKTPTLAALQEALAQHQPGDTVTLSTLRNGAEQEVTVKLEVWSEQ